MPEVLEIRQFQSGDHEAVKALYLMGLDRFDSGERAESYFATPDLDDIENAYLRSNGEFLVGFSNNHLVAMGGLKELTKGKGELKRMAVHPDFKGRGYGSVILSRLLEAAEKMGFAELSLNTTAGNKPSEQLCKKFGFKLIKTARLGRMDVVFYEKRLK